MEWTRSQAFLTNSRPLSPTCSPASRAEAFPTVLEKPRSVKFSTSGGETARSGGQLQPPAGGAAAPHAASRGRHPRGCELGAVPVGVRGPEDRAGRAEWEGQGRAGPGVRPGPCSGPLKDLEQEACAIPWLSFRGERKRAEAEREWNQRGGRAKSHPGLRSRPHTRGPERWAEDCAGTRPRPGGARCRSEPPNHARGSCSPSNPGEP